MRPRSFRSSFGVMARMRNEVALERSDAREARYVAAEQAKLDAMTPQEKLAFAREKLRQAEVQKRNDAAREQRIREYQERCRVEAALAKAEGRAPRKVN